jgi:hypothetical protein
MLEMGLVVAIGLIAMFCKLSWKWRIKLLSYPLALDLAVFVALNALHWGTFSGVMVAAVGALFCSMCISLGRKLFGYIERGRYVPGRIDVWGKLQ